MSKFRSTASQLCGALPYTCLEFIYGLTIGFRIILLAELYKEATEIHVTLDQLTWLESLSFLSPLSSVSTALAMHYFGNRVTAFSNAFFFILSFLLFYLSKNATTIFISRFLTDIVATDMLSTTCISEISEPRLRSRLLAFCPMSVIFGSFFSLLLGNFMYWRNVALMDLILPIFVTIVIFFTPNSPIWLANKGELEQTEKALCWLRGWVQPDKVQVEFRTLVESVQKSKSTSSKKRKLEFVEFLFRRSFYLPFGKMCLLLFLYTVNGVDVVYRYSAIIFPRMHLPLTTPITNVVIESTKVLGNLIVLVLVDHVGKRKLALFPLGIIALCHLSIVVVEFFNLQDGYLWIPLMAVIIVNCADSAGNSTVVLMLVGEIFPTSTRYLGTALSLAFSAIVESLLNKSFLYVVDAVTLPGMFFIFALLDVVAVITYYFIFPETEGKSLDEIENEFGAAEDAKEVEK